MALNRWKSKGWTEGRTVRKISVAFMMFVLAAACAVLIAQQPPAGGPTGGQTGGGTRGPQTPPATGPMLDLANKLVDAINKQDTATLQKMLAPDAVYLDEDGHAPPAARWINKLATGTPAKQIAISATQVRCGTGPGGFRSITPSPKTSRASPKP